MDRAQDRMADALRRRQPDERGELADVLVPAGTASPKWPNPPLQAPRERVARLVRTIESDILPRLARAHRSAAQDPASLRAPEIDETLVRSFVRQVLDESDDRAHQTVTELRGRGLSIECVYLDLLSPSARLLGRMWEDDSCLFSDVTLAVGRLHRLMRSLSSEFTEEAAHAPDGRRVLLCAPPDEQHTFGLAMVSEFFRREGWDVASGGWDDPTDPVAWLSREWFDVVGFSVGSESRVEWLRQQVDLVRRRSRNRAIGVLVGGPAFLLDPRHAQTVGADALAFDGREAPIAAERLLAERRMRL